MYISSFVINIHYKFYIIIDIHYKLCKDQIWLESRIGMDLGPGSPNNKFVDCGR